MTDDMTPEMRAWLRAWLENKNLDQLKVYAEGGRRFSSVATATLKEDWVRNVKRMISNDNGETARKDMEDQQSELLLRDEILPFPEVESDLQQLVSEIEELVRKNPEGQKKIEEGWTDNFKKFLRNQNTPKRGH